jgi:hypothetical protein
MGDEGVVTDRQTSMGLNASMKDRIMIKATRPKRLFKARRPPAAKALDLPTPNLLSRAMEAVEREDQIAEFLTTPQPCALCGSPTSWLATRLAIPPEAQRLGAAPGRTRIITSHLCRKCGENGGVARLEAAMWQELGQSSEKETDRC